MASGLQDRLNTHFGCWQIQLIGCDLHIGQQIESRLPHPFVLQDMTQPICLTILLVLACNLSFAQTASGQPRDWQNPLSGNAQRGAALYQTHCTACHSIDSNKTGPAHRGVMGRRIGSLPGYKYSVEMAASRLRWTPQTLNKWLGDPEDLVAGQRMGFSIDDAQERGDLIAYLATLK